MMMMMMMMTIIIIIMIIIVIDIIIMMMIMMMRLPPPIIIRRAPRMIIPLFRRIRLIPHLPPSASYSSPSSSSRSWDLDLYTR